MSTKIEQKLSTNFRNIPISFVREILSVANQPNMISFAGGLPNSDFFPIEKLKASANAVLDEFGSSILQYSDSRGYEPLRNWIAQRYNLRFDMKIDAEDVVITNGSQQAIDVISKMFINPGDGVIVECPTYLGAIQSISAYSPRWHNIELYDKGPDLHQLEKILSNQQPKLMYSVPNYQNPSGISYTDSNKQNIALLLKRYGLVLIEDDPYNEIYFDKASTAPIRRYAPDNVFWTGSFSKIVAPGLRLGWVVCPKGFANHFVKTKQASDLHSTNLTQYMLYHFFKNNNLNDHLAQIRKAYREQCECMKAMISNYFPAEVKTTSPKGGMFLWATLPFEIDAGEYVKNCIKKGVVFVPGHSFYTNGCGSNKIRINFSNDNCQTIEKGIKIMASELKKMMSPLLVYHL